MDPISLFYLSLGQVSGSVSREDVVIHLREKGATAEQIENFKKAATALAQTAYGNVKP